jgi:hypothetical protein
MSQPPGEGCLNQFLAVLENSESLVNSAWENLQHSSGGCSAGVSMSPNRGHRRRWPVCTESVVCPMHGSEVEQVRAEGPDGLQVHGATRGRLL